MPNQPSILTEENVEELTLSVLRARAAVTEPEMARVLEWAAQATLDWTMLGMVYDGKLDVFADRDGEITFKARAKPGKRE